MKYGPEPLSLKVCLRLIRLPVIDVIRNDPSNCRVPLEYVAYRRSARWSPLLVEQVSRKVRPSIWPQPRSCSVNDGEYEVQPPGSTCACAAVGATRPSTTAVQSVRRIFIALPHRKVGAVTVRV